MQAYQARKRGAYKRTFRTAACSVCAPAGHSSAMQDIISSATSWPGAVCSAGASVLEDGGSVSLPSGSFAGMPGLWAAWVCPWSLNLMMNFVAALNA